MSPFNRYKRIGKKYNVKKYHYQKNFRLWKAGYISEWTTEYNDDGTAKYKYSNTQLFKNAQSSVSDLLIKNIRCDISMSLPGGFTSEEIAAWQAGNSNIFYMVKRFPNGYGSLAINHVLTTYGVTSLVDDPDTVVAFGVADWYNQRTTFNIPYLVLNPGDEVYIQLWIYSPLIQAIATCDPVNPHVAIQYKYRSMQ